MTLHFWICGSCNVADEYNPIILLRDPLAQDIVWQLSSGPATAVRLTTVLSEEETKVISMLSALEKTGAIVRKGELYQLAFPVFTAADLRVVWTIATEVGAEIAYRLAEARPALVDTVSMLSSAQYVAVNWLLLPVVGCFALDWGGLERLEALDYLVRHKTQPGGGDYVLFGAEPGDDVAERFCYSHSDFVGRYLFTTFGDITGSRNAFPDLLWRLERTAGESVPLSWNNSLRLALRLYLNDLLMDVAGLLETAAKKPLAEETWATRVAQEKATALFPLLVQMGYLREGPEGWRPAVPVFLAPDKTAIETAVAPVVDVVEAVVEARYDEMRQALQGISAARNGVPFTKIFTEVWHFIFAEANRILAETGFMASPTRTGPDSARFAAWLSCPGSL